MVDALGPLFFFLNASLISFYGLGRSIRAPVTGQIREKDKHKKELGFRLISLSSVVIRTNVASSAGQNVLCSGNGWHERDRVPSFAILILLQFDLNRHERCNAHGDNSSNSSNSRNNSSTPPGRLWEECARWRPGFDLSSWIFHSP